MDLKSTPPKVAARFVASEALGDVVGGSDGPGWGLGEFERKALNLPV